MIVFDGHTHIYDCYDLDGFVLAAFQNLTKIGEKLQPGTGVDYFLLMAEATGVFYFNKLRGMSKEDGAGLRNRPWRVKKSSELSALELHHDKFPATRITLVAGRQLITAEKLELLALMSDKDFENGQDLSSTVEAVAEEGGIPVCPWGAGKWLGDRGKVLKNYLKNPHPHFSIGDNGGRPSLWPRPAIFNSPTCSHRIVSGSDPLPLKGDEKRVGSFGGIIEERCSGDNPVSCLRDLLKDPATRVLPYGPSCSTGLFLKNQIGLRIKS